MTRVDLRPTVWLVAWIGTRRLSASDVQARPPQLRAETRNAVRALLAKGDA